MAAFELGCKNCASDSDVLPLWYEGFRYSMGRCEQDTHVSASSASICVVSGFKQAAQEHLYLSVCQCVSFVVILLNGRSTTGGPYVRPPTHA